QPKTHTSTVHKYPLARQNIGKHDHRKTSLLVLQTPHHSQSQQCLTKQPEYDALLFPSFYSATFWFLTAPSLQQVRIVGRLQLSIPATRARFTLTKFYRHYPGVGTVRLPIRRRLLNHSSRGKLNRFTYQNSFACPQCWEQIQQPL